MIKILITILLFFSQANSQKLDHIDTNIKKLEAVLESASRSSQKVFVDDFTGLL
jgi:hypothetical protein